AAVARPSKSALVMAKPLVSQSSGTSRRSTAPLVVRGRLREEDFTTFPGSKPHTVHLPATMRAPAPRPRPKEYHDAFRQTRNANSTASSRASLYIRESIDEFLSADHLSLTAPATRYFLSVASFACDLSGDVGIACDQRSRPASSRSKSN